MFSEEAINLEVEEYIFKFFTEVLPKNGNIGLSFPYGRHVYPKTFDERLDNVNYELGEFYMERNLDRQLENLRQLKKEELYNVNFVEYVNRNSCFTDLFYNCVAERLPLKIMTWNKELWRLAEKTKGMVCYCPENSEDMDVIIDRFLQDNNNPQIVLV